MSSCRVLRVMPDDDIIRVLRLVKEVEESKLCLALSENSTLFRDNVNLRLLNAYAREAKVAVALSTSDETTIRRAAEHGIPVYRTPDLAFRPEGLITPDNDQTADNGDKASAGARRAIAGRGVAIATILLIALLGVFGTSFALLPRVHVKVVPSQWIESFTLTLALDGAGTTAVPEREMLYVTAEASTQATGTISVGDVPARGFALFLNERAESVMLPAGTVVTTDSGSGFVTLEDVEVPGHVVETYLGAVVGVSSGRIEAAIEALEPGTAGNVAAGQIRNIIGDWDGLSVRNPDQLSGGSDREVTVVTEADLQNGHEKVLEALAVSWEAEVRQSEVGATNRFLLSADEMPNVIEIEASASPGDRTDEIHFTARAAGEVYWIERETIERMVRSSIAGKFGSGYVWREGSGFDMVVHRYNQVNETIELSVMVPVVAQIDEVRLARRIAGLSAAEIAERLAGDASIADISLDGVANGRLPAWAPWIGIEVVEPGGEQEVFPQ